MSYRRRRCAPGWRMSALGVSFIYTVQTWRAVGRGGRAGARLRQDPDHRLGRCRAPGAGAAIVTIPLGRSPSRRPDHEAPRWAPAEHRHNLGGSLGIALVATVLIASRTTELLGGPPDDPQRP